jgi:hypothetical protein
MSQHLFAGFSFLLLVFGALLAFEVIRPFRDLAIDGPIALACWGIGVLLAALALWLRQGIFALNVTALVLNILALLAMGALLLLAKPTRLF